MTTPTLSQIRQVVNKENQKLRIEFKSGLSDLKSGLSKLSTKADKNQRETKIWFNELDKKAFYIDQRLSQIEYHLGQPTPKFDPHAPIESVFINPIQK